MRWIAVDNEMRIDVEALRAQIHADLAAGDKPFMVIGNAGTVSTGAVDSLPELAALCREMDLWFHVDGAYGGFAALAPTLPPHSRDLARATRWRSIRTSGSMRRSKPAARWCAISRNCATPSPIIPAYYHFGVEAINYFDLGPQNSRGFRALKVWLALQQVGRDGYVQMISDDIRLSRAMFDRIAHYPELEALTQGLSITTFRYVPPDLKRDERRRRQTI